MLDLVITGGMVIDGTGSPPRRADVGIAEGRIVAVEHLASPQVATTVDIAGLVLAPGFIDAHAHTDLAYLMGDEHLDIKSAGVRQGVTTEVTGNCGFSPFPATSPCLDPLDPYRGLFPSGMDHYFHSLAAYRAALADLRLPLNLAPLVGHGRIRAAVLGGADRPARQDECRAMARLADEAAADGAFGLSSGLAYAPGVHAEPGELIAVGRSLRQLGLPYVSHIRDEGDHVVAAVREALTTGQVIGAGVHISHHKLAGRRNWGQCSRTLAMIEEARRAGVDATLDAYPYTAGSTLLADLLPPWVLAGSPAATRERLSDRTALDKMAADFADGLPGWQNLVGLCGWNKITLAGQRWPARPSIADLADDAGLDEVRLLARVLLKDPSALVIIDMMDVGDVQTISDQPFTMIGSDGIPVPGGAHPRMAGSFARTLAAHRDDPLRLADAVRRMTSLPAARFRIPGRGLISPGYVADLVVFDDTVVSDRACYHDPLLAPVGIEHVFVGGRQVIRHGSLTAERPGSILEPG